MQDVVTLIVPILILILLLLPLFFLLLLLIIIIISMSTMPVLCLSNSGNSIPHHHDFTVNTRRHSPSLAVSRHHSR